MHIAFGGHVKREQGVVGSPVMRQELVRYVKENTPMEEMELCQTEK